MATEPQISSETSRSSSSHTIFIDTNLDTHLAMIVSEDDTVQELKSKLMIEHSRCFPNLGKINVSALKVKCKAHFYHLSDGMPVLNAFIGVKRALFLHAEAASEKVMPVNALNGSVGETERNKLCIDYPSGGLLNIDDSLLPRVRSSGLGNQLVPFDGQCDTGNMVGESMKGLSPAEGLDAIKENDKPSSSDANEKCLESDVPKMDVVVGGEKDLSKTDAQFKIYNKSKKRARESHHDGVVEDATKSGSVMKKGDDVVSSPLRNPAKRKAMVKNISTKESQKLKDKLSQNHSKTENKFMNATINDSLNKKLEDGSSLLSKVNGDKEGILKLPDELDARSPRHAKETIQDGSKVVLGTNDKGLDEDSGWVTMKEADSSVAPSDPTSAPNKEKNNPLQDEGEGTLIPCSALMGADIAAEQANETMQDETIENNVNRGKEDLEPTKIAEGTKGKRSKKHLTTSTKGPSLSLVEEPGNCLGDAIMSIRKDSELGDNNNGSDPIHKTEKEGRVDVAAEEASANVAVEIDGCNVESRNEQLELRMASKGSRAKRTKKHQPTTSRGPSPSLVDRPVYSPGDVIVSARKDDELGNDNTSRDLMHKAEKDRYPLLRRENHNGGEQANQTMAVETDVSISNVDSRKEALEGTMTSKKTKAKRSKKHQSASAKALSPSFGEVPGNFPVDAIMSTDMGGGLGDDNKGTHRIHKTVEEGKVAQVQNGGYVTTEETNENMVGGCNSSGEKEPLEPTITTKETKSKGSKARQTRSSTCPSPSLVEGPENCRGNVIVSADKDNEFGNENNITDLIDIVVPLNKDPKVLSTSADKKERRKSKKSKTLDVKGFVPPSVAEPADVAGVANLPRSMPDKDCCRANPLNTDEEEAVSFQAVKTKMSSVADGNNGNADTILSDEALKKDDPKIKKKSKKNKISDTKCHALSTGVENTDADVVNPSRVNRVNAYIDGHTASEANSENVQLPTETMKKIATADGGLGDGTNKDNQIDGMEVDETLAQKEVKVPFKDLKRPRSRKKVLADELLDINPDSSDRRRTPDNKGFSQLITKDLHDDKDGPALSGSEDKADNDMDGDKVNFRDYFVSPKGHLLVGLSAKEPLHDESHTRKKGRENKAVKKNQQLNKHSDVALHDKENSLGSSFNSKEQKKEHLVRSFDSRKPKGSLKTNKQSELVVKLIEKTNARSTSADQTFDQREVLEVFLPIDSRRKIPDASEALGSKHVANSNLASGAKSKLSLKERNAALETSGSSTESSEDRKKRKKEQIEIQPQENHHRGAMGKTSKSRGTVANGLNKKESLLATPKTIFKDSSGGSSEVDSEVNSDASTKTPDNSSSSDYSEGENVTDPSTPSPRTGMVSNGIKRNEGDGQHMKEPKRSFDPKNMPLDMLIRGSSSYKKAKLSASQLDDSEPIDIVPESQA
ncbi:hypothetical protein Syun_020354 [Stephania yunnanensis]|uniref:Uncharacterized protein n=1 Tax=Stephania yunnanensis TaxID=152371 RepID=A0AAP0NN35_9MAGN